jgi:hypothetical protein
VGGVRSKERGHSAFWSEVAANAEIADFSETPIAPNSNCTRLAGTQQSLSTQLGYSKFPPIAVQACVCGAPGRSHSPPEDQLAYVHGPSELLHPGRMARVGKGAPSDIGAVWSRT